MPEEAKEAGKRPLALDLSELQGLSLGPTWGQPGGDASPAPQSIPDHYEERPSSGPGGDRPRRDRRGFSVNNFRGSPGSGGDSRGFSGDRSPRGPGAGGGQGFRDDRCGPPGDRRPQGDGERRGGGDGDRRESPGQGGRRERPEVEIFHPVVDVIFYPEDAPFKALTQAIRTSSRTFELFEIARLILEKPERYVCLVRPLGEAKLLYVSVPDGMPFLTEQDAMQHVFRQHLGTFFDVTEVEVDPPTGNFQMVHRCGLTGELLAPPNYHRYQAICQEHHASRLAHLPYERFQQRLESVREKEAIDAWLDKMRKQTRWVTKNPPEGQEPLTLSNLEEVRIHLLMHGKENLVRPAPQVRFPGKLVATLPPQDPIRRSIEVMHQQQSRFPLDTANHLRGRLRRMNFTVYKRGSKGVSYVSAVKRRFRTPHDVLADNLAELISFLEAHPNLPTADLPREFLGITPPPPPGTETPDTPQLSDEDKERLVALRRDLRYLVGQGYIIEFSNGTLFCPPAREEQPARADRDDQDDLSDEAVGAEDAADAFVAPEAQDSPEAAGADAPASPAAEEPPPSAEPRAAELPAGDEPSPLPEPNPVMATDVAPEQLDTPPPSPEDAPSLAFVPSAEEPQAKPAPF